LGIGYPARVAIPHYGTRIERLYANQLRGGLAAACQLAEIDFQFEQLGLIIEFDTPVELSLYDAQQTLDERLRRDVDVFGPVVVRSAHLDAGNRAQCQPNTFPDLHFHFDRGPNQPNQISMYTRDCINPVQRKPRTSSAVFVANIVAHLQYHKEANGRANIDRKGLRARYDIFDNLSVRLLLGDVVFEQPWTADTTAGETAVIDNRTVLHASYYRRPKDCGYSLGTRYLN
jgi:hypothetical protein